MEELLHDLRYGVRTLLKNPGFTTVAVLALAIGIGANSAIFSVVNSVLLRPLPYQNPEQLVTLWSVNPSIHIGYDKFPNTAPQFVSYRDQTRALQSLAAMKSNQFNLENRGEPEKLGGTLVSADFFSVLGKQAMIGRTFLPEEDAPGKGQVVVLSSDLWKRHFGSDASVVGQGITLNGRSFTIVGVMPPGFDFPRGSEMPGYLDFAAKTDLWSPMNFSAEDLSNNENFSNVLIGRLKPNVSLKEAQAQLSAVAARNADQVPKSYGGFDVLVMPLHEQIVGSLKPALMVLLGAVGFVLLIACANVANLLLARAATRYKEIALRSALGATRLRIIRQLLTESVLLSIIGASLGLFLAFWGVKLLVGITPDNIPGVKDVKLDWRVFGFTLLTALVTGLVFGLVPALQVSKPNLNESLKDAGRGSTGNHHRLRDALVIAEIGLAMILLIGAGLMIRSFVRLYQVNPGLDTNNVLTMQAHLPWPRYPKPEQRIVFYNQVMQRIVGIPGVQSAALTSNIPLTGSENIDAISIEGQPPAPSLEKMPLILELAITPGYLQTLRIPLKKGRDITEHDDANSPRVALVNDAFVRRYIPGEEPVGRRVRFGLPEQNEPWVTIVGLVGDVRHSGLDQEAKAAMYLPVIQRGYDDMSLVLRTTGDPTIIERTRKEIWDVDGAVPIYNILTLDQIAAASVAGRRLNLILMSVFAVIALLLASVGIYGVMSYSVTQRTQEIGIRMSLGAQRRDVLTMVVGRGMALALIGLAVGTLAAFFLTQLLRTLLFNTSATDPMTFVGIAGLLAMVAFAANMIPARRATRIDPIIALRYD
jgi:putative ABC transport system permease protein